MTEAQLYEVVGAAIDLHTTTFSRRYLATQVLDGDMSALDNALKAEGAMYGRSRSVALAGLNMNKLASLFEDELDRAMPALTIRLDPRQDNELVEELRDQLELAAWLAFVAALYTDNKMRLLRRPMCYSLVAWGASVVCHDPGNPFGRHVPLQQMAPAPSPFADSSIQTYVEFGMISPRDLWDRYSEIIKRRENMDTIDPDDKDAVETLAMAERWQLAGLERALRDNLDASYIKSEFQYDVQQYGGVRGFYATHHAACAGKPFLKKVGIAVAHIRYVGLDRKATHYIIPHSGPVYEILTAQEAAINENNPVRVTYTKTQPSRSAFPAPENSGLQLPGGGSAADAVPRHLDWHNVLYVKEGDDEAWVSVVEPARTSSNAELQHSSGVARPLVQAHLEMSREISDFKDRVAISGSLMPASNGNQKRPKRQGPLVFSDTQPYAHQPTVDNSAFQTILRLAEMQIAETMSILDPQVSDNLSGRPTTAEIMARGGAVSSVRVAFAKSREPAIADWLRNAYNTLLTTDYKEHQPGYKPWVVFWATLTKLLQRFEPLTTKTTKSSGPPQLDKAAVRKVLEAFEVDLAFEALDIATLQQRLSAAQTPGEALRLRAKLRLALGEDAGDVARSLATTQSFDTAEEVSAAATESFALRGGALIPVSRFQNHWNHFITHNAAVQEVVTKLQNNPGADPIDAFTSLTQLGGHMADHRDMAAESVLYRHHVESMDGILQILDSVVKQLAPVAKAEADRKQQEAQQQQPDGANAKFAADMERRQASWMQRAQQRAEANAVASQQRAERHQQNLMMERDKAQLNLDIIAATKAAKI